MDNQDTSDSSQHNNSLNSLKEGSSHYKGFKIQPAEFIIKNKLPFAEGNVIKYTLRHNKKNGAEDIKKAIHYLKMILEMQYGE